MRKMAGRMVVLALAAGAAGRAAETTVSVDVADAYVFRGTTLNDGLVAQPGLEAVGGAFTFGLWANLDLDDYDGAVAKNEFQEIDLYAAYAVPVEALDLSIGYTEYAYPGGELQADREVSLRAGLDVWATPSMTFAYGLGGGLEKQLYIEAGAGHELTLAGSLGVGFGATLGYVHPDEGESGFSHYTASVTAGYGILSAGVTYIGRIDEDVLPDGAGAYDAKVVATVGIAWDL